MKRFFKTIFLGVLLMTFFPQVVGAKPDCRKEPCPQGQVCTETGECKILPTPRPLRCVDGCPGGQICNTSGNCVSIQMWKPTWLDAFYGKPTPQKAAAARAAAPRGVVPGPMIGAEGTEAKIQSPAPAPIGVGALDDLTGPQNCTDRFSWCYQACANGLAPQVTANDPELVAACGKIQDATSAGFLCKGEDAACVYGTCGSSRDPSRQKAVDYLACSRQNVDNYLPACPELSDERFQVYLGELIEFVNFMHSSNIDGVFTKATGLPLEPNAISVGGCAARFPPNSSALFYCVAACWMHPYLPARCMPPNVPASAPAPNVLQAQ